MPELPDIKPTNDGQDIRLIEAARNGETNLVRRLIANGLCIDASDANGVTALIIASMGGHADVVGELVLSGANLVLETSDGWNAYQAAMFYGDFRGMTKEPYDQIMSIIEAGGYETNQ